MLESVGKGAECVILRIMMPYGSHSDKKKDLGRVLLERLEQGLPIQAITDAKISPVFVDDLAEMIKGVLENKDIKGLYHVSPADSTTLFDFVKLIAKEKGLSTEQLNGISFEDYWREKYAGGAAKRPKHSWLDSSYLSASLKVKFRTIEESISLWLSK